jgi:hypothetical protein
MTWRFSLRDGAESVRQGMLHQLQQRLGAGLPAIVQHLPVQERIVHETMQARRFRQPGLCRLQSASAQGAGNEIARHAWLGYPATNQLRTS